jgi:hypothetical protein
MTEAGVRRLLLVVALVAVALTFSVLPTSFATGHGAYVPQHRVSVGAPAQDQPVISQSPDSVEQPSDDLLIVKRLVTAAVTATVETAQRASVTRTSPAGRYLAPVHRAELQVWQV